ncbi:hypothetical protein DPX16_3034 [Anabarilius grahami]|uniref:Uncharacterized protein n=1 Tax=Anabarilius grahami TaxID=495550 RepID=A0A3N0XIY4_ANAGA|nr:hypothetical protein DPX16_3034 [Anabarilius grahami]
MKHHVNRRSARTVCSGSETGEHRTDHIPISQKHKRGAKSPALATEIQGALNHTELESRKTRQWSKPPATSTPAHKLRFIMRVETVNLRCVEQSPDRSKRYLDKE